MTEGALTVVTYLWHYLVARLVYDQLVRPAIHGHLTFALVTGGVGAAAFLIGRWTGIHGARRGSAPRGRP